MKRQTGAVFSGTLCIHGNCEIWYLHIKHSALINIIEWRTQVDQFRSTDSSEKLHVTYNLTVINL